jgi:hypothetical protein
MTLQRTPSRVVVALALLAAAIAAEAAPITVDFTVTSNDVSNPAYGSGETGGGYFTVGGAMPDFDALGSGGAALTDAQRRGLAYGPIEWSVRPTSVPEPGALALLAFGAVALAGVSRRRASAANA